MVSTSSAAVSDDLLRALLGRIPDSDLLRGFGYGYETYAFRPRSNVERLESALQAGIITSPLAQDTQTYMNKMRRVFAVADGVFDAAYFSAFSLLGQLRHPQFWVEKSKYGRAYPIVMIPLIDLIPCLDPKNHEHLAQVAFDFFGTEYSGAYVPVLNVAKASEKKAIFFGKFRDRQNEYYRRVWGIVPKEVRREIRKKRS
jgi:hypothetical protein